MSEDAGLERFLSAQAPVFERALRELARGRKESHWMWFVFPQHIALGRSPAARAYGIASLEEAKAYLAHPVLGDRLATCARALLRHHGRSAHDILGFPDDLKLRSSMTLFARAAEALGDARAADFRQVLEAFYGGEADPETLRLLGL